jgi:hypothetical protein
MKKPSFVAHIDDEREFDHGYIVTLKTGYTFADEPDCGVRAFDTLGELKTALKKENIIFSGVTQ